MTTSNARNHTNPVTYKADAVLCTLPLGVLKQSIAQNTQNPNTVSFTPPLPDWKVNCLFVCQLALMFRELAFRGQKKLEGGNRTF